MVMTMVMENFQLAVQLQKDGIEIGDFPLCRVLLINDSQFPWCVLVPRRKCVSEIYQLAEVDRQQLMTESCMLAETLHHLFKPDKINIAAIGNLVPQLHIHHVARYRDDKAWPAPIWGKFAPLPYSAAQSSARIVQLQAALQHTLLSM